MTGFLEAVIQYSFLRNAILAALLASIACGVIGTYVVTRRIVFISGGISHASFGGIGLGFFLGVNPIIGALGFALASALAMGALSVKAKQREDTAIGVLWALGFALGILFAYATPGFVPNLSSYLFGNILFVSATELVLMILLDVIIVAVVALLYKEFLALSFDEEFARVVGVKTAVLYILLLCLIALAVVVLIKVVGIVLVIAMLTIPVAIAGFATRTIKTMMLFAVAVGMVLSMCGLWFSWIFDVQSGATIVVVSSIVFLGAAFLSALRTKRAAMAVLRA